MRADNLLTRCSPAVPRRALYFVSAAVWLTAGGVLVFRGGQALTDNTAVVAGGLAAGLLFFRYLFVRISERNIAHIRGLAHERPCVFSFIGWRGYSTMLVMITAGISLRSSGLLPPVALGVLSLIMGTPLLLSSVRLLRAGLSPSLS